MDDSEKERLLEQLTRPTIPTSSMGLDPSLVKWQLDDNQQIDEMRSILKGELLQYDPEKKEFIKTNIGEPLMNDLGVRVIVDTFMRSIYSKNIKLTNFNQQDVHLIPRMVLNEIARLLFVHGENFGIRDLATQSAIMEIIRSNIVACFKRAYGEGERKFIKGYAQETTINKPERKFGLGF